MSPLMDIVLRCALSYQPWLLLVSLYLLKTYVRRRNYRLPPCPHSWPIIGNIHHVLWKRAVLYRWCRDQSAEYGPVIRVRAGPLTVVVVSDYERAHEALADRSLDGRMKMAVMDVFTDHYSGLVLTDGDHPSFNSRRKLLATSLRQFSVGRPYEERVRETLSRLLHHLDEKAETGESFDPTDYCHLASFNIIASICFQKGYAFDDPELLAIRAVFKETFESVQSPVTISDVIPFVDKLPFQFWDLKFAKRVKDRLLGMIEREMNLSLTRGEECGEIGDLILYAVKMRDEGRQEGYSDVTDLQIRHLVNDVFTAGTDTTQMTLRWILVLMACHQDVQAKVYDEIMNTVSTDDILVSGIDHRTKMPYSDAVLLEVLRYSSSVPMGIPHTALRDTRIGDYDIPKGTMVVVNQWAVNYAHENAEDFTPERFLDGDGKVGARPRGYMPFGMGRRACPGEWTARNTLWILYTSLIRRYQISPPPHETLQPRHNADITLNPFDGAPKEYRIILKRRQQ